MQEKSLIRKLTLFEIYNVTKSEEKIPMHIVPNISRRKGNQKMAFDQVIEYNM